MTVCGQQGNWDPEGAVTHLKPHEGTGESLGLPTFKRTYPSCSGSSFEGGWGALLLPGSVPVSQIPLRIRTEKQRQLCRSWGARPLSGRGHH